MELFVSTTASARATAPLSFSSLHGRTPPYVAVPLLLRRRRLQTRGWRCAGAAVPDPVPSEEPASASASTVVVTEKPASASASTVVVTEKPAAASEEEKSWDVGAVSGVSGGVVEATAVAMPVWSEASEEDGGIDDILSKLDTEVTPTYVLYGSGAFVVLWILSSVVSAIDSIPLLPKVLELVGIGYSIWFTARYLLFKENRDELFAKFQDLKERIV